MNWYLNRKAYHFINLVWIWKYIDLFILYIYRGADKSLARQGRKHATATEDFGFHISYL
jgi:hypothetical protein